MERKYIVACRYPTGYNDAYGLLKQENAWNVALNCYKRIMDYYSDCEGAIVEVFECVEKSYLRLVVRENGKPAEYTWLICEAYL